MTPAVGSPEDDQTILDQDRLLRRIFHASVNNQVRFVVEDAVRHERVPTSAGFAPDEDGLSVYLERLLSEVGSGPEAVVTEPMNAVASLLASSLRKCGLGIVRDPHPPGTPDPEHPRHAAHCLATGWAGRSRNQVHKIRKALAAAATLIVDPGDG